MQAKMFVKKNKLYTLSPYNRQFINELKNIESRRYEEPYNTVKITKDKRDAIRIVHLMNRYFGVPEINIPDVVFGHAKYLKGSKFSESILFTTEYSDAFRLEAKSLNGKWNNIDKGWELNINSIPAIEKVKMLVTKYEIEYERGTEDIINDRYSRLIEAREKKQALVEMSKKTDLIGVDNIDTPDGVTLYPFQQVGVNYIKENPARGILIADDTGLGKTAQALTYCYNINKYPVLIISPASVKLNWSREIKKFCNSESIAILKGRSAKQIPKADFIIINYDIISNWKPKLRNYGFKVMIMDEAQYIKNPKSLRSAACFDISKCKSLEKVIALSATPMMSRPVELLPILRALDIKHEDLESDYTYKAKYCLNLEGYRPSYNGANNLDELNVLLRETCMIRRLIDDVLPELPDKVRIPVTLDIKNRRDYKLASSKFSTWYRNEYHASFEGKSQALAKMENLRQLAANGKMTASIEYIENILESAEKIVIFAHHRNVQNSIFDYFSKKYYTVKITGGMSAKDKLKNEDEFQNGDARVIVCSMQACKTGINLQAANTLIFLELSYVPSDVTQSEGRIRRIGSTGESCFYHYLVAENTIEEHMLNIIANKQTIIDQAIDSLSAENGESNIFDELLAIFE